MIVDDREVAETTDDETAQLLTSRGIPWKYDQNGHPTEITSLNREQRRAEAKRQKRKAK